MMLLLGQTVNLIPDATTIPQLFIFLAVMIVLYFFVFRPTLKILDRRREVTAEFQKEAERLSAEADAMDKEYNKTLLAAKNEGTRMERELLDQGEVDARKIIADAKRRAYEIVSDEREKIKTESSITDKDLSKRIGEFSMMIVQKVLGNKS